MNCLSGWDPATIESPLRGGTSILSPRTVVYSMPRLPADTWTMFWKLMPASSKATRRHVILEGETGRERVQGSRSS